MVLITIVTKVTKGQKVTIQDCPSNVNLHNHPFVSRIVQYFPLNQLHQRGFAPNAGHAKKKGQGTH